MSEHIALITGGAKRIGAGIAEYLHQKGMKIIIHYRHSVDEATALAHRLNAIRPDSAAILELDLKNIQHIPSFISAAKQIWGYFDVLINNASEFYPTPLGNISHEQWNDLMNSNLTAPFFLSQAAIPILAQHQGCIINIVDIKAERPAKNYSVYTIAKAGLAMLTKSLAKDLAPKIRVNALLQVQCYDLKMIP